MSELSRMHAERQRRRDKEFDLENRSYLQGEIDKNAHKIEQLDLILLGLKVRLERVEGRLREFDQVEEDQNRRPGDILPGTDLGMCL